MFCRLFAGIVVSLAVEYGGKWKLLHYFAKKFFSVRILSAYVERDTLSLYYINDDIHRQTTRPQSMQTAESWPRDSSESVSRSGDVLASSLQSVSALESRMERSAEENWKPRTVNGIDDEGYVDMTDTLKHSADSFGPSDDNCTVMLQCFGWTSFEPRTSWNITFPRVGFVS